MENGENLGTRGEQLGTSGPAFSHLPPPANPNFFPVSSPRCEEEMNGGFRFLSRRDPAVWGHGDTAGVALGDRQDRDKAVSPTLGIPSPKSGVSHPFETVLLSDFGVFSHFGTVPVPNFGVSPPHPPPLPRWRRGDPLTAPRARAVALNDVTRPNHTQNGAWPRYALTV